jgi:hypothetical protein
MKRLLCLFTVLLCCLALVAVASAAPNEKFAWGSQTGPASAGPPAGAKLILNINMQVTNDPDSGEGGN